MSKLNLDELFQQKLNHLEVPHKPEYWTQMEEELEAAAPVGIGGVGAGLSKIYTISGIVTSVVVISFIAYFAFNNHSLNKKDTKMLTTSIANTPNTSNSETLKVAKQTKQYEASEEKSIASELPSKDSNSNKKSIKQLNKTNIETPISNIKSSANINQKSQYDTDVPQNETVARNEVPAVVVADVILINNEDNFFSYDPRNIINNRCPKNEEIDNKTSVCNELIVIKPITKPTKSVFNKRRGLLYRLGIRK